MTPRPHTLKPHGIEGPVLGPSRPYSHRMGCAGEACDGCEPMPSEGLTPRRPHAGFELDDLEALQAALASAPFTLAELAALVRTCPKTLAALRRVVVPR